MTDLNLKKMWADSSSIDSSIEFDEKKIDLLRQKSSDQIQQTLHKGILVDSIFKAILNIAALSLPFISGYKSEYLLMSIIAVLILNISFYSNIRLMKKLKTMPVDLSVTEQLQQKLQFLKGSYKIYLFNSGLSAPMFVFIGNAFYFHFKYGYMNFDFVIVAFLAVAFAVGYFSQYPVYELRKREIIDLLEDFDEAKLIEIESNKTRIKKIFSYMFVFGCLVLALIITIYMLSF